MADRAEPLSERQVVLATGVSPLAWPSERQASVLTSASSTGSGRGRVAAIAAALALVAAAVLLLGFRADSRLTYELRGGSVSGNVIDARRGEATVALSDGSSILAENGTKFSVDVVGRNAAVTRLVAGKLHVRVAHNEDTSYRFEAGPYEVRVVGTELELAWDPSSRRFALSMLKGQVELLEAGTRLRTLRAGQSLRLPAPSRPETSSASSGG